MRKFKVGDKIKCINNFCSNDFAWSNMLIENEIYTIYYIDTFNNLRVKDKQNNKLFFGNGSGFAPSRFRLVIPLNKKIKFLKELL